MNKANRAMAPLWTGVIPDDQWSIYREAIRISRKTKAPFVLGGAFGMAGYTRRWRNTKDLDLFVMPHAKDKLVDALTKAGFDDYFPRLAYDRRWIYRAIKDEVLVDIIWQTPNRRSVVDEEWFKRCLNIDLRGEEVTIIPAEELLVIKLYVMQRDRCDWPDLINLLYAVCDQLDWPHVLRRLDKDRPLLAGLLQVFKWIAPARAAQIPAEVRREFHVDEASAEELALPQHRQVNLLDTRPWFASFQPENQPMQM